MNASKYSSGFTLVEVLISILILSLGLMGVAALQSKSLGSSHTASQRSQAVLSAADIADRMRANRVAADPTAVANYGNIAAADNNCRVTHYGHVHGVASACTPVQLAADDLFDWLAQMAAVLPAGTGVVCIDSTPNDGVAGAPACDGAGIAYAIKIFWTEKADVNAAASARLFVTAVRP
jgi:type IV pilus assembly protein PilV